jgi:ParB/RepB/Spo0J family partition protein
MAAETSGAGQSRKLPRPKAIAVSRIRPEEGLGRKRDKDGHRELCRSIEKFGVLTPITVRLAPDGSGDYLLIKGQGRTMACQILGLRTVPAIVVDQDFEDQEKVQQFLVENVARLRMHPIDRALLIAHSRRDNEETVDVAARFGVSPSTVRRLEAQLDGATASEVSALKANNLSLSLHAVVLKHVSSEERAEVIQAIGTNGIRAKELEELFIALGWHSLTGLGVRYRARRITLLRWSCETLARLPRGDIRERLGLLALQMPLTVLSVTRRERASTA